MNVRQLNKNNLSKFLKKMYFLLINNNLFHRRVVSLQETANPAYSNKRIKTGVINQVDAFTIRWN